MEPMRAGQDSASYVGELLVFAIRRSRWLIGLPLFSGLVAAAISLLSSFSYTAVTTFVPESQAGRSVAGGSLAGIASQFGLTLPIASENSPQFFAQILSSRTIQSELLETRFLDRRSQTPGDSASLIQILGSHGIEQALHDLNALSRIDVDPRTSIVSVSVTTHWPELSADVANRWIDLLNRFNSDTRRLNASELRKFLEGRLVQSEAELHAAEGEVRAFLERNRISAAPALQVERERLERRVTIKQEVYVTQLRQLEDARVAEVNNVAMITVVDRAVPPQVRSGPRRTRNTFVGVLLGLMMGLVVSLILEYRDRLQRGDDAALAPLRAEWARLSGSLRLGRGS